MPPASVSATVSCESREASRFACAASEARAKRPQKSSSKLVEARIRLLLGRMMVPAGGGGTLVVLIGLAAKNAILIVEFAQQGFLAGKSATEAALNAARLRFRPIVMTSLAFVLGVMPLMLSTGAGAAARRSMGTGVVGGMLAATFIATLFIPLFFTLVARRAKRRVAEPSHELVAK